MIRIIEFNNVKLFVANSEFVCFFSFVVICVVVNKIDYVKEKIYLKMNVCVENDIIPDCLFGQ